MGAFTYNAQRWKRVLKEFSASWHNYRELSIQQGFLGGSEVKASACNAGDLGSIPGLGRSPGERNGNPLQYSCLANPMDGEAWSATVHGVAKSQAELSDLTFTFTFHPFNKAKEPRQMCFPVSTFSSVQFSHSVMSDSL